MKVSRFASPVVLVRKKVGKVRFCVDHRKLNEQTVIRSYPVPDIQESLDGGAGAKIYTTLDMESGYHQIRMGRQTSPDGLYHEVQIRVAGDAIRVDKRTVYVPEDHAPHIQGIRLEVCDDIPG